MDKTMISFHYQGYRLLIFYTCSIFFAIPYQCIIGELILVHGKGVTILFEEDGRRGRKQLVSALLFCLRVPWTLKKIKKQTNQKKTKQQMHTRLGRYLKEGVFNCNDNNMSRLEWRQFTWTNLSEAWPTSLLYNMHVTLGLFVSRIQWLQWVCRPIDMSKGWQWKERLWRVLNHHAFPLLP